MKKQFTVEDFINAVEALQREGKISDQMIFTQAKSDFLCEADNEMVKYVKSITNEKNKRED